MIDYALWEVIENGAILPKTQVVEGVTTVMPITSVEKNAQKRLEVKARNTLMMGISNEHQLLFNSIKDANQLLEAIEKRFVNTANGVSTTNTQVNDAFFINIDNLSDAIIYAFLVSQPNSPQLAHEDLEQIHPDDMEEMDLRWQMDKLKGDTLLGSAELQELKTTNTRKAQEGVCLYYEEIDEGYVAFGGNPKGGNITRKCTIKNCGGFRKAGGGRETRGGGDGLEGPGSIDGGATWFGVGDSLGDDEENDGFKPLSNNRKKVDEDPSKGSECNDQDKENNVNSTHNVNATGTNRVNVVGKSISSELPFDLYMPALEEISIFDFSSDHEDDGEVADMNNLDTTIQMDVKSAFLYGKFEEEVYVYQLSGFKDPDFPNRVYKVEKHCMDYINLLGHVKQKNDGIFICQDKYVGEILKKFGFTKVKNVSTPMETQKPVLKDEDDEEVDVHMYRIFRYLKDHPKLGLWYPKDSSFDLVAYIDSDYDGASLNRKSTTGGCQYFRSRLISWQCKKQTVAANSITEAEYMAASSCYGQMLWIHNQLLDYGFNSMHTKIFIDNNNTIFIIKNPIFHSKTKHIEIRHHFIRDCNEKKLIQMVKIHTDKNVADFLTKAFNAYTYYCQLKVNADSITYYCKLKVNASRHKLLLLGQYGKEIIITESSVRRDLRLADEEGIDCLLNSTIFENLELMG
nr:putative ribonuclease H-like domain-containing protein [Tanacetum cinerariifolium]